jgi:transcriptional regulator with XRE-family HTH domain
MASLRQQVGQMVRHHRRQCGLTQAELAERVGKSVEMINRIERGITAPGFKTLEDLSTTLKTPIRDFFPPHGAATGRKDPLDRLVGRVAGLEPADLKWVDDLVALALNRKVRRPNR